MVRLATTSFQKLVEGDGLIAAGAETPDASNFLASLEGAKVAGAYVDPSAGRHTFATFAEEWAAAQQWKDTTRDGWRYVAQRLEPLLGALPVAAINRLVLQQTQRSLIDRYARATVELTMHYAGSIMRSAYASGRIGRDPTRGLRAPKVRADEPDGKVGPDDVPTRAEALAIWQAAPDAYRAGIALGLSGLRVGEVLGLSVDRLELDRRRVTINRQLQYVGSELVLTTPKAEKVRTITVPRAVALELRRHLRDHQGAGPLFRGRRGAPMLRRDQFYASAWWPALDGAGIDRRRFTFQALRHFCASSLLAEGAPLTAVAGHLGDTVETISRTYLHWLRDDRDVPAEVLARILVVADEGAEDVPGSD